MQIQLSDHFTYGRLLRFVFPSILTMFFTTIYSIVDAAFVSNFVGKTSFAAVNLVMPVLMLIAAPGVMMGAGGYDLNLFKIIAVLALPIFFGLDGIWSSCAVAETASFVVTAACIVAFRKKYGYC